MGNTRLKVKMKLRQTPTRDEVAVLYEALDEADTRIDSLDTLLTKCMALLTPEQIQTLGLFDDII